jgi:signal transduction histidine kinase
MKTRLTLTAAALLLAAMLLVNIVLLALWRHDAIQREAGRDQAALLNIAYRLAAEKASPEPLFFAEFYPDDAPEGQLALVRPGQMPAELPPLLAAAAAEALATGRPVSRLSGGFMALLRGQQPVLASARPLLRQNEVTGAAAVSRPLLPLFAALWQAEKIVLIYMVVNLLALTAIFFFRLNSLVVRPVERLAALAGRHSGSEAVWFAADDSGSEFNRLAGSLNRMLAKIADDRAILQKTVAELEAANRQLHERQEEMIRAEKLAAAGRMAAGLAHEIGNPLAVIQGYLDLLARSGQNEENSDFIRRAVTELERVTRLVRQLLDCTRASKGKPEDIALHSLLAEVAEMVRVQKAFRQIELVVRAEAAQDSVHADPDQLRQVLLNCLLNSADAISSAGQADGAITLATDLPEPGLLRLRIEDNGVGIAAEQLAAVFDPFFTTKEPGRGTGLGLSVSRSIVETAGGFMTMESRTGQGSAVSIYLPLAFR